MKVEVKKNNEIFFPRYIIIVLFSRKPSMPKLMIHRGLQEVG